MKVNINMKRIVFFLLVQLMGVSVFAQQTTIKEAEAAYRKENYNKAIELYEKLLKDNGESASVYYNLGNAYYKAGKVAPSILNYERALILNPGDGDIRFNLQMARLKAVDRIEPAGDFFLLRWFHAIENVKSADAWACISIVCFILLIACLILFFFSKYIRLKKLGFYGGVVLLLAVICTNIFAADQKDDLINRKFAIIFSPTVTIKSSPDTSGTDLFILHEGTKVCIKSTLSGWKEISTEDGNVGWLPSTDIQII